MQFYVVHFMSYIFVRLLSGRADGRLFQTAASRLIEFKPIRLMLAPILAGGCVQKMLAGGRMHGLCAVAIDTQDCGLGNDHSPHRKSANMET